MKTFVILDTETNGLPLTPKFGSWYPPSETRYYDTSRVIQIAVVSSTESHIWNIKPENFIIENAEFHGITQDMAMKGVQWRQMISELLEILSRYDVIVGHNVIFDINVIASELYRRGQIIDASRFLSIPYECTMHMGKFYMRSHRFPKLIALYEHLFHEKMVQTHNALEDCNATFDCYTAMKGYALSKKFNSGYKQYLTLQEHLRTSTLYSKLIAQKFYQLIKEISSSK
jgi:DNA polymerase III subunit alpha